MATVIGLRRCRTLLVLACTFFIADCLPTGPTPTTLVVSTGAPLPSSTTRPSTSTTAEPSRLPDNVVVDPIPPEVVYSTVINPTTEAQSEWPSTNEPKDVRYKPRITSMHVDSNVTLRYAKTLVTSKVSNPDVKANEVTFSVVIPETAFITAFSMEIDGKVYDAYVKEKDEAKKEYQTAVSSGIAAAHVAVKARDSNHFTVSVNVEPQKKAIFRLYYEELLTRRLGLYNLVMNLSPGQLVEDFAVDVDITETSPITAVHVPSLRTGNEVDAEPTDAPNEYAQHTISEDKLNAKIHFAPNKEQQQELMKMFKEREKSTPEPVMYYMRPSPPVQDEEEGVKGQFVVQYDVDREVKSEVMINDGYFVHFFAPGNLKPLNKHVIFVLDVSGSMVGRKIDQLKSAMISILENLNPGDFFSIMDFHYSVKVYNLDDPLKNAVFRSNSDNYMYPWEDNDEKPQQLEPPAPYPATKENIAKAKEIIMNLYARGGTNIYDALTTALKVANTGIQKTETAPEYEASPLPEPMVIFLTDGDPTVGETNTSVILSTVSEMNPRKVAIFSLAFGEDADRGFLRRVALQNSGFLRHIYEAADAAQQLRHFYRLVASPLLANVTFTYPKNQIEESSLTKKKFDYYFLGSELVVAGKVSDKDEKNLALSMHANASTGPIDFIPTILREEKRKEFWPLERMWAYIGIKQLLDERDEKGGKAEDLTDPNSPAKKALDLALKYSFVTPLTSLVVVKPNSTSAVDAESVDASGADDNRGYALPLLAGGLAAPAFHQSMNVISSPMLMPVPMHMPMDRAIAATGASYSAPAAAFGPPLGQAIPAYAFAHPPGAPAFLTTTFKPYRPQSNFQPQPEADSVDYGSSPESAPGHADPNSKRADAPAQPLMTTEPEAKANQTIPATPEDRMKSYGLDSYPWLTQYLDGNEDAFSIPLPSNSTLKYKLKHKDHTYPDSDEKPCPNSLGGGLGECRYLTSCKELNNAFKDLTTYLNYFCDANGFAGICCKVEAP